MATSGKKGKKTKKKQTPVPLSDFLASNGDAKILTQVKTVPSWAQEVEDDENYRAPQVLSYSLPTAPRASRSNDDVPENPPYMAHLSNLPFELEEEDIKEFFGELETESIRLPREDGGGRSRGFGYVEFTRRNDLIAALNMPDPQIRNRRIRIDVSIESDQKRQGGRGGGRYDGFGSSGGDTNMNWRKEGRNEDDGGDSGGQRRGGFGYSSRSGGSEAVPDTGNWRDSMKTKVDSPPPIRRGFGGDRGGDRGGFGGDRDRDRYGGRSSGSRYEDRNRGESRADSDAPTERPKLNLKPRTLPLPVLPKPADPEELKQQREGLDAEEDEPSRPEPTVVPAAAIFGDAKPVDTAAKEREIEARLERQRLESERAAEELREQQQKEKAAAEEASEKGGKSDTDEKIEKKADAEPVVNSWRRRDDEAAPRTQSPPRRRFSPERRGGNGPPRRNDDRRDNNRDFSRRDNNRDYRGDNRDNRNRDNRDQRGDRNRGENNYNRGGFRDNHDGGDREITRGDKQHPRDDKQPRDEKIIRRSDKTVSADGNAVPAKEQEVRLPKYQPPEKPKLQMSNAYEYLDDGGSD